MWMLHEEKRGQIWNWCLWFRLQRDGPAKRGNKSPVVGWLIRSVRTEAAHVVRWIYCTLPSHPHPLLLGALFFIFLFSFFFFWSVFILLVFIQNKYSNFVTLVPNFKIFKFNILFLNIFYGKFIKITTKYGCNNYTPKPLIVKINFSNNKV